MGLFSSKKQPDPADDIPADILADVTVNGEKEPVPEAQKPVMPTQSAPSSAATATSPFLKSKSADTPPASLPISEEPVEKKPSIPDSPIQFSDQPKEPVSEGIHFTESTKPVTSESMPAPAPVTTPTPEPVSEPAVAPPLRPDFSQITQDKALTEKQKEHPSSLKPTPPRKKSVWTTSIIVIIVAFVLIIAFIAGGTWYYLQTRKSVESPSEMSIDTMDDQMAPQEDIAESKGTILTDQPNYLTLDVETVTTDQIQTLIQKEGEKIQTEGVTVPVEYLVVDMNKNPVAFSRFAFLIGADTPDDLVKVSLEPFSLYLFIDQGVLRMALAVPLAPETSPTFPANKNALPVSVKNFFYPKEYSNFNFSGLSFAQTKYKENTIWYANIDIDHDFSFDMSTQDSIITFANSKETLRAVIDKRLVVPEQ